MKNFMQSFFVFTTLLGITNMLVSESPFLTAARGVVIAESAILPAYFGCVAGSSLGESIEQTAMPILRSFIPENPLNSGPWNAAIVASALGVVPSTVVSSVGLLGGFAVGLGSSVLIQECELQTKKHFSPQTVEIVETVGLSALGIGACTGASVVGLGQSVTESAQACTALYATLVAVVAEGNYMSGK